MSFSDAINTMYMSLEVEDTTSVWVLIQLILSLQKSRCYTLINKGKCDNNPQENTVPHWFLNLCTCGPQRCHCNAKFQPNILCVKGLLFQNAPPLNSIVNHTMQFIKFTYCNNRFSQETIDNKGKKYQTLLNSTIHKG